MTTSDWMRGTIIAAAVAFPALPAAAQERPVVAAANYPLAYFAERLGEGVADVIFPIPADVDPSFWRPGISDIAAIQAADVIALNGAGFATWPTKASLPRSRTIDTSQAFSDRYIRTETVTHSHGDGGEHSHTATANYTWLDFSLAAEQAATLSEAMIRQMPDDAADIAENRDGLIADLAALDARAAAIGEGADGVKVITSHPRYQYFGAAYSLDTAALDWDANTEPTQDQWVELEALISSTGASLFVWEAQPTDASRERIALLGIEDVIFPPLANRTTDLGFLDQMTKSLDDLETALTRLQ